MTINNKGFTLIELIATIVVLALVMGIASYSITEIIKKSKDKNYDQLINEINAAVESYYLECKYVDDSCSYQFTLGSLVTKGFLKGNETNSSNEFILVNPRDNVNISSCRIKFSYSNGKVVVQAVNPTGSCPTSY